MLPQELADTLGDRALLEEVVSRKPPVVGLTLYSWNSERSAALARGLKREASGTVIVAGGPEVYPDNDWLLEEKAFDLLVCGEAEGLAAAALDPEGAARLARSGRPVVAEAFQKRPGSWPNPYLTGHIAAEKDSSVYVETVRGCSSGCIFCSYRRSHPRPRVQPAEEVLRLLGRLPGGELTFLDPTFNTRPDVRRLLAGMRELDRKLFAEVRGEPIDAATAESMADAGFAGVEVGLQSTDPEVRRLCGRGGDPQAAMRGAANLRSAGVAPVVDLIIGLPGDTPRRSVRSAAELYDRGLAGDVQVFELSVLPGTEIRRRGEELGIRYMERPPYLVSSTPGYPSPKALSDARMRIADMLGYGLFVDTRPALADNWPGDEKADASLPPPSTPPPSRRHGRLILAGEDLWADRRNLLDHVHRRIDADPYCVLDVVLRPRMPFPLDLLDLIADIKPPQDYTERLAAKLGTRGRLRVSVMVDADRFPEDWLAAAAELVPVVLDLQSPRELPGKLAAAGVGIRLPGRWDTRRLRDAVKDPEGVFFRNMSMEAEWSSSILGLR